eukprot:3686934-Pleurochrysis_carterae.AAC.1
MSPNGLEQDRMVLKLNSAERTERGAVPWLRDGKAVSRAIRTVLYDSTPSTQRSKSVSLQIGQDGDYRVFLTTEAFSSKRALVAPVTNASGRECGQPLYMYNVIHDSAVFKNMRPEIAAI